MNRKNSRVNLPELNKAFDIMSYRKLFIKLEKIVVIEEVGLVEGNNLLSSGFQMFNFYSFS